MRILIFIVFFCAVFCAAAVQANQTGPPVAPKEAFSTRYHLPGGTTATVEGIEMKCFPAPQYQTVILLASDYGHLYDWRLKALGRMQSYDLTIAGFDKTVAQYQRTEKMLRDDISYLNLRLKQSHETINDTLTGFRYEKYALWAAVIIETGYILVKGIID